MLNSIMNIKVYKKTTKNLQQKNLYTLFYSKK